MAKILFIFIAVILIFNCGLEPPKAPRYEIPLQLLFIDTTFTAKDFSNESENLYINDQDNLLYFCLTGTSDTFRVDDQLMIHPENYLEEITIDDYVPIKRSIVDSSISLGDLIPGIEQSNGTYQVIPSFSINAQRSDDFNIGEIMYISISSGIATMRFVNKLSISIDTPVVRIYDSDFGFVEEVQFPGKISPGESSMATISLSGKKISNRIYLALSASSPGSQGNQVLVNKNDHVEIHLSVDELKLSEAEVHISEVQYVSDFITIELSNDKIINEAKFHTGKIKSNFENNTGLEAKVSILFLNIFKPDGSNLFESISLNANSERHETFDLEGLRIQAERDENGFKRIMKAFINIAIENSDSEIVHLSQNDWIAVSFSVENIIFESFTGTLNQEEINIHSNLSNIDLPEQLENIQLQHASLKFYCYNRINFPIEAHFDLKGVTNTGKQKFISISENLNPGDSNQEVCTLITLDDTNSDILEFLSDFPASIELSGRALFGDGVSIGSINQDDYVRIEYEVSAPMRMAFDGKTIATDTTQIVIQPENFDDDVTEEGEKMDASISKNLLSGDIILDISNHFPIGIEVLIVIDDDLTSIMRNPQLSIGPIQVAAGKLDADGEVFQASSVQKKIDLTEDDLQIFKNETDELKKVYIVSQVNLDGTDGSMITVRGDDYIKIKATSTFHVKINQD